jgi:hypothetical protein
MKIDVNTDKLREYTKKLKSLGKSAFPVAVRQTLNDAAFNVKLQTMPKSADKAFVNRQKNFFKANSKAIGAEGMNVQTMHSDVGFYENKLNIKSTNYAVKDLEQQEYGGSIKGRDFIARKEARTGSGIVKKAVRITELKDGTKINAIVANRQSISRNKKRIMVSQKQAFIRAAIVAKQLQGDDALVLGNIYRGKSGKTRTLSKINSVKFTKRETGIKISRTPLYQYTKGRLVAVKSTNFMRRASYETSMNMDEMYIKRAQERFKKHGLIK